MEAEQEPLEAAPLEAEEAPPAEAADVTDAPEAEPTEEAADLSVLLRGRCAIFPDQPLPQYSSKHAVAFHATMRNDPMRPLFALLTEADMPARVDFMDSMRSYNLHGILQTADWG